MLTVLLSVLATVSAHHAERSLAVEPFWWARHIAVAQIEVARKPRLAIIDTGGDTELRESTPRDFATYYRGLPVDAAIGSDSLERSVYLLGSTGDASREVALPLDVRPIGHDRYSFVMVRIDRYAFRMLFDTGAFGWSLADENYERPYGINFLRSTVFQRLRKEHPGWHYIRRAVRVANERGAFVVADAIDVPSLHVGSLTEGRVRFVERDDDTTYAMMRRTGKIDVSGDLGLAALDPKWLRLDVPRARLAIGF